ncbi:transporter [Pedobacter sp. SYP-B3415]|uniref:transporter n=1 Tax=Pedobacter sp. SYP-B3415 TaxID=2496641 RepID=UPI0013EB7770|nr:transporter [Pedobacter sp. SYP-B3415]
MKTKILILLLLAVAKAGYTQQTLRPVSLFNPVPKPAMRQMETDRPDITESAITLDAGHFQLETNLAAFKRERNDDLLKSTWLINDMILKLGLGASTDIQLDFETYVKETTEERLSHTKEREAGNGNLTLRIKQNILGNNRGNFAVAVLPYVRFPIAGYGEKHPYEGGLIVPMQLKVGHDWKIGAQVEVDRLEDMEGHGSHTEFLQSLTLSHPLLKKLDGIAETHYTYDFKQHHFSNFLNAALQLEVYKDVKIDGGLNYGLQKDAEKRYFLGLSLRI